MVTPDCPYFLLRRAGRGYEAKGQPVASFGHRIASATHPVDDGVFASWSWDGSRLVVHNDREGIFPVFWCRFPDGGIGVASSPLRLIEQGAKADLDADALAVFLRMGIFLGEDTPFANIKVVPPNADFEWSVGELACRGRYPNAPVVSTVSRDDAIDAYVHLFANAMAKRLPASGNVAVPISGGRDSRHILLELHRIGLRPAICVSVLDNPPDPNRDPVIGKALCDALGFQHIVVDQRLSLFQAQRRKNHETHFCAGEHGWYLALADFLNGRYDATYDGLAGDVLSQSSYLEPSLDRTFRSGHARAIAATLLDRLCPEGSSVEHFLEKDVELACVRDAAIRRLEREVAKHVDAPNPIASFFFWNRTRRMTALAPYALQHEVPAVYAPFLDHELFDFMNSLPAGMLMDRTFHSAAIARAYPAFAQIPYADNKHDPHTDDRNERSRFYAEAARGFVLRRPWSLMRNVVPRARILAAAVARGRYNVWQLRMLVYLDQLDAILRGKLSET